MRRSVGHGVCLSPPDRDSGPCPSPVDLSSSPSAACTTSADPLFSGRADAPRRHELRARRERRVPHRRTRAQTRKGKKQILSPFHLLPTHERLSRTLRCTRRTSSGSASFDVRCFPFLSGSRTVTYVDTPLPLLSLFLFIFSISSST